MTLRPPGVEGLIRTYTNAGRMDPQGTVWIERVEGAAETYRATLHAAGRSYDLGTVHQPKTRNWQLAVLGKALALAAERK